MSSATHILTLEEALALPVDRLEEIVNGEIRRMPPPEKGHFRLITVLARLLSKQLPEEHFDVITTAYGLGIKREPAVAVRIPDITVFEPSCFVRSTKKRRAKATSGSRPSS